MLSNKSAEKFFGSGPADQVSQRSLVLAPTFQQNKWAPIDIPKQAHKRCPCVVPVKAGLWNPEQALEEQVALCTSALCWDVQQNTECFFHWPKHELDLQAGLTRCTLASKGPKHPKNLTNLRLNLHELEEKHFPSLWRSTSEALNWCSVEMSSVCRWERSPLTCSLYSLHIKSTLFILGITHLFCHLWSLIFNSTVRSLSEGLARTRCIWCKQLHRQARKLNPHTHPDSSTPLSCCSPVCCTASAFGWPQVSPPWHSPTHPLHPSSQQWHF